MVGGGSDLVSPNILLLKIRLKRPNLKQGDLTLTTGLLGFGKPHKKDPKGSVKHPNLVPNNTSSFCMMRLHA